jgi:poly-gamma-glutamate synthase PgsB/CapB
LLLISYLLMLLIVLGAWETWRHARHRRRIPVRIHVNGSRGKSSVARLIAAGLKAGGMAVVGKTTGSTAAVINTDGTETPIVRRGTPNIKEQLSVFRRATRQGCEALVIECMAIRPDLQKVCEHGIVHATHGVITNVRPDHLDVMGPTMDDVAASLAGTVPRRARLFTSEDHYTDYFADRCRRAGSEFTHSGADAITDGEMDKFPYVEFPENVGLALDVCRSVGIDRGTALAGMWTVTPDTGAMTVRKFRERTSDGAPREVEFINGFAANDPDSYRRVWRRLGLDNHPERAVMLLNLREDRQRRSKDLAPLVGGDLKAAHYVLVGGMTGLFAGMLRSSGVSRDAIHDLAGLGAADLWQHLVDLAPDNARIIGVGNIAGIGLDLLAHLEAQEDTT